MKFQKFFTEPLIQFIILGGLLYLLVANVQKHKDTQAREILVDNDRIALMITNYKSQTGNLPTKQQLDAMIEDYIKEEVLYREAKKMGLDKDDEIIRRRLSQKIAFMQNDLAEVKPPTETAMQQFYKDNLTLFQQDATVGFSHIYFSTDNSTDSIAKRKALAVLQQLKSSNLQRAPEKGDRFPLQYDYTAQSAIDVQQNFGNNDFKEALFESPVKEWTGPVKSGYGWHLLFILKRDSTTALPFALVKEDVKIKYLDAAKEVLDKKKFDALINQYSITRAYLETK